MSKQSDIHDPRVSDAYRDVATETTSARLDRKVLAAARDGARTRYGLARAWTRPLAWAATIALSFAFVLQMTREEDAPAPVEPAVLEERAAPTPVSDDGDVVEQQGASDAALLKARELRDRNVPQAPARSAPGPAPAAVDDVDIMPADTQETRQRAVVEMEEDFAATAARFSKPESCDAAARADADSWFECIEALREKGLDEAADAELEALQATFPDFRAPIPD